MDTSVPRILFEQVGLLTISEVKLEGTALGFGIFYLGLRT
jgi:hypothetical protein